VGPSKCTQAPPSVLPLQNRGLYCKLDIGYWNFSAFRFFLIVAKNFNQAMSSTSYRMCKPEDRNFLLFTMAILES